MNNKYLNAWLFTLRMEWITGMEDYILKNSSISNMKYNFLHKQFLIIFVSTQSTIYNNVAGYQIVTVIQFKM